MVGKVSPFAAAVVITTAAAAAGYLGLRHMGSATAHPAPSVVTPTRQAATSHPAVSAASAPTNQSYVATFTCRADDVQVPVMGCFQGDGGYLKVDDGEDVKVYTETDFEWFTEADKEFPVHEGFVIQARDQVGPYVLRLEVKDAAGKRLFSDEASGGDWISVRD